MSSAPYVFKRGAVYWWRRRLPNRTDSRALVPTEISLNTKELHEAKKIAADVTQASERLLPLLRDKMISAEDAKKILVKVALSHSAKLDAVAANEIAYGADVESSRRQILQQAGRIGSWQPTERMPGSSSRRCAICAPQTSTMGSSFRPSKR